MFTTPPTHTEIARALRYFGATRSLFNFDAAPEVVLAELHHEAAERIAAATNEADRATYERDHLAALGLLARVYGPDVPQVARRAA